MFTIRPVTASDSQRWAELRKQLWPGDDDAHDQEIKNFLSGSLREPEAVLVAEISGGLIVGFEELSIREDVPGLAGIKTGYVEGLYVVPEWRGQGLVLLLLHAAIFWARDHRCVAFASDRAERVVVLRKFPS